MKNRLENEKSPYLLQHADNPVDWFPWGDEAFEKAISENKPIFLSIGYATCHWCHVMEKETFESEEIANLMNNTFINIKVDREEHPEVDGIYMEFAQALMSSAGGWPLNVVLTPNLKPFFAVTYLPPKATKGLIGMDQFVTQIQMLWESEERNMLLAQADKIVELFQNSSKTSGTDLPQKENLEHAVQMLFDVADPLYGGIKGEPKFPMGYQADFLLQYSKTNKDSRSLFYIELTLQMMAQGGIYDHLGGGFSRYCVDEQWQIPHFEKMLYDNAILANTYLLCYQYTKKTFFGQVCRHTLDYVLNELKDQAFFSAEDADSEGQEGKFYVWTRDEIEEVLGQSDGEIFCRFFGVTDEGNFEGKNILHVAYEQSEFAKIIGLEESNFQEILHKLKNRLLEVRNQRVRPFKDDKIITSWNGLMIHSLAKAALCFEEQRYLDTAEEVAIWIEKNLFIGGELKRRFRDGDARFSANLDDYAFLIRGLLSLFEATGNTHYFSFAKELTKIIERDLKSENGAYYQSRDNQNLLIRKCEFYDGAEPSGNAVHCENLLRFYQFTQDETFLKGAEEILKAAKTYIETFPPGACYHLLALQRYLDSKAPFIVVALNESRAFEKELRRAFGNVFSPHVAVVWKGANSDEIDQMFSSVASQGVVEGKTTVHICYGTHCEQPITDIDQILEKIESL